MLYIQSSRQLGLSENLKYSFTNILKNIAKLNELIISAFNDEGHFQYQLIITKLNLVLYIFTYIQNNFSSN